MSQCTECYELTIAQCDDISVKLPLDPNTNYTWQITDKWGKVYKGDITTDANGYFTIGLNDLPEGLLTPFSGDFLFELFDGNGSLIIFSTAQGEFKCILFSVTQGVGNSVIEVVNSISTVVQNNCCGIQEVTKTGFGLKTLDGNTGTNVTAYGYQSAQGNTGDYVTAIGENAASYNTNDFVTAIGNNAANGNTGHDITVIGDNVANVNTGSNVIAIGEGAAYNNAGDDVIAIGNNAGSNNVLSNSFIINPNCIPQFTDKFIAALTITVANGAVAGQVYLYIDQTDYSIKCIIP